MRSSHARNIRIMDPVQLFPVTRDVPAPELDTRGRCTRYPFDRMRIGDSFAITDRKTRWKVGRAASGYAQRHPGYRFIVKSVSRGRWRCWRV